MTDTDTSTPIHPDSNPAPHLAFLDDVEGEKALTWVKERNAEAEATLASTSRYGELRDGVLAILDSTDKIPGVVQRGDYLYNVWTDAEHERGLWRRTTWESYRSDNPEWEVLIDVDALAEAEDTPWVWHGATVLRPENNRALIDLSRGGSDADVTREFDLETKQFVDDGFYRPEAKGSMQWADTTGESVFVATDFGEGSLTDSGYPRIVKRLRRDQPMDQAETIFEGETTDISVGAAYNRLDDRTFVYRSTTFYTGEFFELTDEGLVKIDIPESAHGSVWTDWLIVRLRDAWQVGGQTFAAGSILVINYEEFLSGKREFTELFAPTASATAVDITATKNFLVLTILDDVVNRIELFTPPVGDDAWTSQPLDFVSDVVPETAEGQRPIVTASVAAIDSETSDDLWVTIESFNLPSTLAVAHLASDGSVTEVETLKSLPAYYDANGVEVSQHFATSEDGTKVPYFQISPVGATADGSTPTLLYGYGGFEVSLTPSYFAVAGKSWVERGGVYVIANIRGGGEYGPQWHKSALKENRHKAYEDFAAVAKDLVERGVTTPEHLGAQGGSNGGLLMGNMLTQYPELFGAIVCQVPLLDMRRYTKLLAGASWAAEYGDPDDPAQWEFIKTFSPFHLFDPDASYPPILFTTSTRDDRVHPAHARTLAFEMLAAGKDVTYFENIEGGHGGAATNAQRAMMQAYAYEFLWQRLN